MNGSIQSSVQSIKGIGRERAKLLAKLGIFKVEDLLYHFPFRYEDRTKLIPLNEISYHQRGTFYGKIVAIKELKPRPKLHILKVLIEDQTGRAQAIWFNQAFLKPLLKPGTSLMITGRVDGKYQANSIVVEEFEKLPNAEKPKDGGRIIPIYSTTAGLSNRSLRRLIQKAVLDFAEKIENTLPESMLKHYKLPSTGEALKHVHLPEDLAMAERARKTLAYEELLLWQLKLQGKRAFEQAKPGLTHKKTSETLINYLEELPYQLTNSQKKVLEEIFKDMERDAPMARLLQGDVGSGKTVIALAALLKAIGNGYQGVFMVPTEILAEQHFLNIKDDLDRYNVNSAILTGSLSKDEKERVRAMLKSGELNLVIGTHALLEEEVEFLNLGLVVIDEQHRFGVAQRGVLLEKAEMQPDLLIMTATPIPRTLALTFYGDLDISTIDELPPGRVPVETKYLPENKRLKAYTFFKKQMDQGFQGYIVCPLVEDSEKIEGEAAIKLYEELKQGFFKDYSLGLVYGSMGSKEKEKVMKEFRDGQIDLLVATTVIEVGVDVPNANFILINDVQRFGLAQLHQLRGRVGRSKSKAYCFLMGKLTSEDAKDRVKSMISYHSGFSLAEEDLKIRGPGDFFGVRQHGIPKFKAANLLTDHKILQLTRKDARIILEHKNIPIYAQMLLKAEKKFSEYLP